MTGEMKIRTLIVFVGLVCLLIAPFSQARSDMPLNNKISNKHAIFPRLASNTNKVDERHRRFKNRHFYRHRARFKQRYYRYSLPGWQRKKGWRRVERGVPWGEGYYGGLSYYSRGTYWRNIIVFCPGGRCVQKCLYRRNNLIRCNRPYRRY